MADYIFRPATRGDLPLLRSWRRMPHVVQWWGEAAIEDPEEALQDPRIACWIVAHRGRIFAYAQDYSPHDWSPHPFAYLPAGARGVDHYIGDPEMLGRGHGPGLFQRHCERLFAGRTPVIGTDPSPDNVRAIRAYEKAGFKAVSGPVDTRWGRSVLMEKWP
ncbi:MAG: GNAT family N-acetyltransferase [Allosphingosinicella sp.]